MQFGQGRREQCWLRANVGVQKQEPLVLGCVGQLPASMLFAVPIVGQRVGLQQSDSGIALCDVGYNASGGVFGVIVQDKDFEIRMVTQL
jgi:hypothetical protein